MKTTITENLPNWSHRPQPYLTQWNYEPCHVGLLKTSGSWWRVLAKRGPLEKEMANHFSILGLRTPWSMKRQKDRTLKDELSRLVGAQYTNGDQWRNNSRMKRLSQCSVVDMTGDESKVLCYKEKYCIGTWNVRSMNQGKLEVVKRRWQEWTLTF